MCGRFEFNTDNNIEEIKNIIENISVKDKDKLFKSGEVFPTDAVPVLKLSNDMPEINLMSWGIPKWDGKGNIINARSETVREKELFKEAYFNNRCVILSTGFYEWNEYQTKGKRDKYLNKLENEPMLYMAGLYKIIDGEERFIILTKDSNFSMEKTHHRMPVILNRSELIYYLRDENYFDYFAKRDDIELKNILVNL